MSLVKRYALVETGSKYSTSYAAYFYDNVLKSYISPFHDIPLFNDQKGYLAHMIVEIPRWTNAKLEINTKSTLNPIKQDVKKGKPRFVNNIFPFHGYPWNYGALPQTWEDPDYVDLHTGAKGDNDPVDIIDIGCPLTQTGNVVIVKIVGCIALIDEGETDWKIIGINIDDPRHEKVSCLKTLKDNFPGILDNTIFWLRNYKVPCGSGQNKFAFEGEYLKDREFAMEIINCANISWKALVAREACPLSLARASDPKCDVSKHSVLINEVNISLNQ
ncbi:hypothetical protein HZS_2901 [Henneguya salminicola]|uniref:inorganic diphosphatase n=1 Tax=Henneguya salminicola TaxID=69463 RepID=A0A6G3MFP0_HENSL|nr:hypothetical protein HZS_2901 [Henneguya salminicola]